jgi:hypothetical protein
MSEHDIQVGFIKWMRLMANQEARYNLGFSIPNGAHLARGFATMKTLKAEGLSPGVPDFFLAMPASGYHGLFIEFKFGKNKASSDQALWMHKLNQAGYCVREIRAIEDGQDLVINYLRGKGE